MRKLYGQVANDTLHVYTSTYVAIVPPTIKKNYKYGTTQQWEKVVVYPVQY